MAQYRLYCMDGAGKIDLADWIEADSDTAAVQKARDLKMGNLKCEVWLSARLVMTLDAQDLSHSSG